MPENLLYRIIPTPRGERRLYIVARTNRRTRPGLDVMITPEG